MAHPPEDINPMDLPEWMALEREAKLNRERWWGVCEECGNLVDTPMHVFGCRKGREEE